MLFLKRRKTKGLSQQEFKTFEDGHISKSDHVTWKNVEDRVVILNTKNARYYSAEDTASRIWELIDKGISVSELVKTISCEYGKNEKIVKRDLAGIVASMKREDLIKLKT